MVIRASVALALLVGLVVGCDQPSDGGDAGTESPGGSAPPGGGVTPIAPAIEVEPSGPDPTIPVPDSIVLPSVEPVAPAIEVEPTSADPTIDADPD